MARQRREEARRIGLRIAELREHSHLTQPAAAERARVSLRAYQTWEAGDATPRWHNYEKLAKVFGVEIEDILRASPPPAASDVDAQLDRIEGKLDQILELLTEDGEDGEGGLGVGGMPGPPDPGPLLPGQTGESPSEQAPGRSGTAREGRQRRRA